jgi:Rrf2 family transcriptional regulator, iron-sulfur cluster assembly transcription factor
MFFSKSFAYACRAVLYVAVTYPQKERIQVGEIAGQLGVPKHFLSKIMKKLVKHGVLDSTKGPYGGFSLNEKTLSTPLFDLIRITEGDAQFENCVLRFEACNATHPCPLHHKLEVYRICLHRLYKHTRVVDLLDDKQPDFIKGISTIAKPSPL